MRIPARAFPALFATLALVALAGCPTVQLGKVTLADGSVSPTGFTLHAIVQVDETEPSEGEAQAGRGLLALNLPDGWKVTAGRMKSPHEGSVRTIIPVPQAAVAYGETFPLEPGWWWAFATHEHAVPQGSWTYEVELDVVVPKKTRGGTVGLSAGLFNDAMDNLVAPTKFKVELKGRKGSIRPAGGATATEAPKPEGPTGEPATKGGNKASGG